MTPKGPAGCRASQPEHSRDRAGDYCVRECAVGPACPTRVCPLETQRRPLGPPRVATGHSVTRAGFTPLPAAADRAGDAAVARRAVPGDAVRVGAIGVGAAANR